ncbi:MAG: cadherin-like domain-containing protein, partial [Casimicrobiaceae bacterium]
SLNVLANDSDPDGDPLTITTVGAPAHGSASIAGNRISYTPTSGFVGTDTFTYAISDGHGGTASATVTITVLAVVVNHPPVARDDTFFITQKFTDLDVLANDSDPDGDPLTIISVTQPILGTVQITSDGKSLRFTQPLIFNHTTFTYTISDGRGGTSTATVTLIDP